jgi:hypothetical protein
MAARLDEKQAPITNKEIPISSLRLGKMKYSLKSVSMLEEYSAIDD